MNAIAFDLSAPAMPSVHNPTNFEPSHYTVLDYLDNKRPEYCGGPVEGFQAEINWWQEQMQTVLGADWQRKCRRCIHCGNTNVRWITAVTHEPTGEVVVFGADCTERLGFENRQAWKLAQLKSKAETGHARLKVWKARAAYLAAHPEVAAAIEQAKGAAHARNSFAADVLSKLDRFGSISEAQSNAVIKSLARDLGFAARKAAEATETKGAAPTGRVTVTGRVVSVKLQESQYGATLKMLVKLENNSRVWLTAPSGYDVSSGDTVTLAATFAPKTDDPSFAFGKRPHMVSHVKA